MLEQINAIKDFEECMLQPGVLPEVAREKAKELGLLNGPLVYAMADLIREGTFEVFGSQWWIVYKDNLLILETRNGLCKVIDNIAIEKICDVKEISLPTKGELLIFSEHDSKAIARGVFTLRQKSSFSQLSFVLGQLVKEKEWQVELDADSNYRQSVIGKILEEQQSHKANDRKTLLRLLTCLVPYKKELVIGAFGATVATAISLVPAYLSGYMVDNLIRPFQDGKLQADEALHMSFIVLGALATTYLTREIAIAIRLRKMSAIGEYVARDLRAKLYSHLQTLGLDFFGRKQTGSLISRVSSDTDRIWDFVAFGVVEVTLALFTLLALSIVLISLDWRLGLIMVTPIPLLIGGIFWHGERMKKIFLRAWRKWTNMTAILSDTIPGIQVVKAFNQESREIARFNKRNELALEEFLRIHKVWTSFWPWLMMCVACVMITVWWMGIPRLLSESTSIEHLTAGTFVSFLLYMTMYAQPIETVGQVSRMLNRAVSSAYRIFEVLDTRPTMKEASEPVRLEQLEGRVEFDKVFFTYDGVRQVLKGISFQVKEGEMIGLVGASGGGKTTITKLLARFYDVQDGSIKIDGFDVKNIDIGCFRKQLGMVLQEPFLFHGTIWENIMYGLDDVSKIEIIKASKVANAHDFIMKLPMGYDTVVGERGHTLSGGERQRVSIARAILHNPRILILDEATSAVDTETEHLIQEALDKLIEGRTVFAVAHRLSTLRKADRLFVIGDGKILEEGTHNELLAKQNGQYRKLYDMQLQVNGNLII